MKTKGLWGGALVLAVAASAAPAGAQGAGGEEVGIPLRAHGGRLVVPVQAPDGTELAFLLSTGTAVTVLSEAGARRVGSGGPLLLGTLQVPTEDSETVPDEALTVEGEVFHGVIGPNMLSRFDVLIDLPRERLLLGPAGRAVDWEGTTLSDPVPLRVFHGIVLSLDVELNGVEYPAMLDLSVPGLLVNERVVAESGIGEEGRGTLRVGGATFDDLPVAVSDRPIFRRFSPNGDGFVLVGTAVALDCALALSWARRELRTCVR